MQIKIIAWMILCGIIVTPPSCFWASIVLRWDKDTSENWLFVTYVEIMVLVIVLAVWAATVVFPI